MVSLSNHARAARESARVEGRIERTNRKRRCLAALFFALLIAGLTACTAAPSLDPHSLSVELCSSILPLPDTTPDGAVRKPFEEKMVQVGLLKRLGEVTLRDGRHAMVYDVNSSRASSLNYIRRRSASQPAIVAFCYGTIQPTHIINVVKRSDSLYIAEFDYDARLKPWAHSLYTFLHLRRHGVATDVVFTAPNGASVLERGGLKGIPTRSIELPPDGKGWYFPGQLPVKFRWPPMSVIISSLSK